MKLDKFKPSTRNGNSGPTCRDIEVAGPTSLTQAPEFVAAAAPFRA